MNKELEHLAWQADDADSHPASWCHTIKQPYTGTRKGGGKTGLPSA